MKNWIISQLDCYPKSDNLNDVVFCVHWRRTATETVDGKTYYADVYGTMSCSAPDPMAFTPYADLTFDQVCGWLDGSLDVELLDENLDNQIANQINPPVITPPLPWQSPTPVSDVASTSTSGSQQTGTAQ